MDNKDFVKKLVGSNIRRIREEQSMSQEELAEIIGLNPPAISEIECGKRYPKPENIYKIAEALNVSIDTLFKNNCLPKNAQGADIKREISRELSDCSYERLQDIYNIILALKK